MAEDKSPMQQGGPRLLTFGCRLNAFEAEVMRGHATAAGLNDAIIVNTCAVTAEAERQARQAIRKMRRENPAARIVVTGCAAQIAPDKFAAMAEVDHVIGNEEKLQVETFIGLRQDIGRHPDQANQPPRIMVGDIMRIKETAGHFVGGLTQHIRAFIEIQQGCDHRCTFCIIPFGRGNNRSVPVGEIVSQARRLVAEGAREIVLTGVDITGYGADLPGRPNLGQLVRRLLNLVPDLPRLRLSSLDVVEVDEILLDIIGNEQRVMPHLHLSLQSGDDMILKRMKRRHNRADAVRFCQEMRRRQPDIVFGADLIAGFPTESEAMFENSLALIEDCGLSYLHVFPYSARSGTPAAKMPQVSGNVRRERAARLRAAGDAAQRAFFSTQQGSVVEIVVETLHDDGSITGHSRHFAPVRIIDAAHRLRRGDLIYARILHHTDVELIAETAFSAAA